MYTINFFTLKDIGKGEYLEEIETQYELNLSSLEDVRLFLRSDFYKTVFEYIDSYLDGIVIKDERIYNSDEIYKDAKIIYKECFFTDTLFDVYKDGRGNNIYKAIGAIEDDYRDYVMVDKHKFYYR